MFARTEMPPDGHAAAALFALAVAAILRDHLAAREVARREVEMRRVERHEPREQHVLRHLCLRRQQQATVHIYILHLTSTVFVSTLQQTSDCGFQSINETPIRIRGSTSASTGVREAAHGEAAVSSRKLPYTKQPRLLQCPCRST